LAEGRIGYLGQLGSQTINGRTVPWIWSAIEFDSTGVFTGAPHEIFPSYSVYVNGNLQYTNDQSSVPDFAGKNDSNQVVRANQLP
jgi:hypothetical protein